MYFEKSPHVILTHFWLWWGKELRPRQACPVRGSGAPTWQGCRATSQGLPGASGLASLFHFDLFLTLICHTPHVLSFLLSPVLHRTPPGPAQSLSLSLISSVNRAQPWSTSVVLALVPPGEKPCPLGALQRGRPCSLHPALLAGAASGLHLRPTALPTPYSCWPSSGSAAAPAPVTSIEHALPACLCCARSTERQRAWRHRGLRMWLREKPCCAAPFPTKGNGGLPWVRSV